MNRKNYIFVDYENVQVPDLHRISGQQVEVVLVVGERHKMMPIEVVELMQRNPGQIRIVRTELNGKNALDFVLACELGIAIEKNSNGFYHILSKDKGFDALIKHLTGKKIHVARNESIDKVLVLQSRDQRLKKFTQQLQEKSITLPGKRKTLEASIQAALGKGLGSDEVSRIIKGLIKAKILTIGDTGEVTYS